MTIDWPSLLLGGIAIGLPVAVMGAVLGTRLDRLLEKFSSRRSDANQLKRDAEWARARTFAEDPDAFIHLLFIRVLYAVLMVGGAVLEMAIAAGFHSSTSPTAWLVEAVAGAGSLYLFLTAVRATRRTYRLLSMVAHERGEHDAPDAAARADRPKTRSSSARGAGTRGE